MSLKSLRNRFSSLNHPRKARPARSSRVLSFHSQIEALEGRQLMASDVTIAGDNALSYVASNLSNNITITYNSGTDTYTLNDLNDTIDVFNNGTAIVNGSGTNTVNVSGLSSLAFTNLGGIDTYTVGSIGDATSITNTTGSNNTINIGISNTAQGINAPLSLLNTNATTFLRLRNSADATSHSATFSNTGLTGMTPGAISFTASQLSGGFFQLGDGNTNFTIGTTTLGGGVSITSGAGTDTFAFTDGATIGTGLIDAGSGVNSLDYTAYTTSVTANLQTGLATGTQGATSFRNVTGGSAADTLSAANGVDGILIGGRGGDTLNGSTGLTTFIWNNGDGSDVINGTAGLNNVVVNGSNTSGDAFELVSNGSRKTFRRTNLIPFSLDIEAFSSMTVNGLIGDDSFTVDFSVGNPVGTSTLNYDGGSGTNSLALRGGSFTNESYEPTPGVFGSGNINLDATQIGFLNTNSIADIAGASTFNFTFPGSLSAPTITNGPTVFSTATSRISSGMPLPTFAPISIANKTAVNLTDEVAGDTITLNNSIGGAGIQGLAITATGPGSSLRSTAAPDGVATSVFLGGTSVATVTAAGFPATGSFTVDGGPGINSLTVDGAGTTGKPIVGPSTISVDNRSLTYFNFQTINLPNAASTPPAQVTGLPFTAVSGTPVVDRVIGTFTSADEGLKAFNFGATINWGDGSSSAGVVTQDATVPTLFYVSGTHTYLDGAAVRTAVLSVRNLGGTSTTVVNGSTVITQSSPSAPVSTNLQVTVADAAIVAQPAPVSAIENLPFTGVNVASFSVADLSAVAGDYTATIDWGDLSATSAGTITAGGTTPNGVTFLVAGGHRYTQEGTFTVTVTINSIGGSQAVVASTAFVKDGSINVIGNAVTATAGTPLANVTIALVSDAGGIEPPNSYTATVNWGDGVAASTPILSLNGSTLTVQGGHTFVAPGNYIGSVTVRTAGGSVNTASFPINVVGLVGTTLPVSATEDVALNNVPLISFASNGGPAATANFYAATIDWGDATPITPGAVDSSLRVLGNHTYDEGGTYTVRITIATDGNPNLLVYTRTLVVADVPIVVTGSLDPNSDSGISNSDKITNVVQPLYTGTSEPLSKVTVTATPIGGGTAIVLGTTTTDTAGAWQVRSNVALADGTYSVTARAIDRNDATQGTGSLGNITIDTIGPKVDLLTFNRIAGQVDTWLSDERSGLAQRTIIDNVNYSITKPHNRPGRLLFTSLVASAQTSPTDAQRVTGLINGGQPLRGATYTLTVADGITDVAGNKLDGEFYGYFPSGNGKPGGNFVAIIDTFHGKVFPAKPENGYGSPNVPPGIPARGYLVSRAGLVADAKVISFFRGQFPNALYSVRKTNAVKTVTKSATPKITLVKNVTSKVVTTPHDRAIEALVALSRGGK